MMDNLTEQVPFVPPQAVNQALDGLLGTFIALGLYGVFCVLFCITIYLFCFRRNSGRNNRVVLAGSVAIFAFTTLNVVLQCQRLVIGVLYAPPGYTPDTYLYGVTNWSYVLQLGGFGLDTLTADALLLYRLWHVWGHRWRFVVFNSFLWLAYCACLVRDLQLTASLISTPDDVLVLYYLNTWYLAGLVLCLVQTTTATVLLTVRLWKADRAASAYKQGGSFGPIIRMIVESVSIYAMFLVVTVAVTALTGPSVILLTQLGCPVIGIAFSLLNVRIGLGWADEGGAGAQTTVDRSHASPHRTDVVVRRDVELTRDGLGEEDISVVEEGNKGFEMKRRNSLSGRSARSL